mmetsp:Transcript_21500/g.49622  ORF Transcript_21500/g.49622 Transcript_21500/m.49622 type:complete len:223 (+) Transcript_21500:313-981(+)
MYCRLLASSSICRSALVLGDPDVGSYPRTLASVAGELLLIVRIAGRCGGIDQALLRHDIHVLPAHQGCCRGSHECLPASRGTFDASVRQLLVAVGHRRHVVDHRHVPGSVPRARLVLWPCRPRFLRHGEADRSAAHGMTARRPCHARSARRTAVECSPTMIADVGRHHAEHDPPQAPRILTSEQIGMFGRRARSLDPRALRCSPDPSIRCARPAAHVDSSLR